MSSGNQYIGRKARLLRCLHLARIFLAAGMVENARRLLKTYRNQYRLAPASTKRRWRSGN